MRRILVLGGTGFVGPFVVQQLVERGHDVTLFHRGSLIGNAFGWQGEVLAVDGALLPPELQAPLPPQDL